MMGRSPRCYIPSFLKIGPPVLEKKIFEEFFTIYGHSGHLGHVTSIRSSDFHFLVLKAFIQNLVQNGPVVSEKIWLEFLYVHDLGPRSSNDLDLQYSHTFMKSISCLYLQTFRSQASIVSENPLFSLFPIEKPMFPNLTLP